MLKKWTALFLAAILLGTAIPVYGGYDIVNTLEDLWLPEVKFTEEVEKEPAIEQEDFTSEDAVGGTIVFEEEGLIRKAVDDYKNLVNPAEPLFFIPMAADPAPVSDFSGLEAAMMAIANEGGAGTVTLEQSAANPLSFANMVAIDIHKDTNITLYYAGSSNPLVLTADVFRHFQFTIDDGKKLTLKLENIILDGQASAGGIDVLGADGHFEFAGGTIRNCQADYGGGISGDGSFTLSGGEIYGNIAGVDGGGLWVATGANNTIAITGGDIYNNTANNGGGVLAFAGKIAISGGNIYDNIASNSGGGIYAMASMFGSSATLELGGGEVYGNEAYYGGGLYATVLTGSLIRLSGSHIHDNTAYRGGGINIEMTGGHVDIRGGSIYNNTAPNDRGGGLLADGTGGTIEISGGEIYGNFSENEGGGLLVDTTVITTKVSGGEVYENSSRFGGGLYIRGDIEISGGQIHDNTADGGGGLYIRERSTTINGGHIYGNSANNGGGLYITGSVDINGGHIYGNSVDANGGGLYVSGRVALRDGKIYENEASKGGGVWTKGEIAVSGGKVYDNTATDGGGIWAEGKLAISGGEVYGNTAANGGGVWIWKNIEITNGHIYKNRADSGGGVFVYDISSNATIGGGKIYENAVVYSGGGVFVEGDIKITSGNLYENSAYNGGGLFVGGDVMVSGGSIHENTAENNGGGVFADNSIEIRGGNIHENTAGYDGGGLWAYGNVTVRNGRILANTASNSGGGIYIYDIANLALTTSNPFADNLAGIGYLVDINDPYYIVFENTASTWPFQHILNNYDVSYTNSDPDSVLYSVMFMKNNGTSGVHKHIIASGPIAALEDDFPETTPVYSGYEFTGWYLDKEKTDVFTKDTPLPGKSIRVYAGWEKKSGNNNENNNGDNNSSDSGGSDGAGGGSNTVTHTISFNTKGGSAIANRSAINGNSVDKPANPMRDGYIFTGWYTDAACTTLYNFDKVVTASFTLYAGWKPLESGESLEPEEAVGETIMPYIFGYPDSGFKPEAGITRGEAAQLIYNLMDRGLLPFKAVENTSYFSDVSSDAWYHSAVTALASTGAISGYPDGTFKPGATLTRAEFTAMVALLTGLDKEDNTSFIDVELTHWAAGYIAAAEKAGIISGYPNGSFGPEDSVTRAQAVTILNSLLNREVEPILFDNIAMLFSDVSSGHWAFYEIMADAVEYGYAGGRY